MSFRLKLVLLFRVELEETRGGCPFRQHVTPGSAEAHSAAQTKQLL